MTSTWIRSFGAAAIAAFLGAGCSSSMGAGGSHSGMGHAGMAAPAGMAGEPTTATKAAELRAALNALLGEHVVLVASATQGALAGRQAQFTGAAAALDQNSVDIARAIGSVYGQGAQDAFLPLWRKHIGFAVDYTTGVATKDAARQQKAVADLVQYTEDFGAFLASANPNLPKAAVAELVKEHVLTLKDVIDAQATGDQVKAFAATRKAYAHMVMIGDPLAGAIAKQFASRFPMSSDAASGLRSTLTMALREHVYLAARAATAALGKRDAEFQAAAGALDANSVDIAKAIGSVYGAGAEQAFLPLWRRHIGFVVDYTVGVATKDQAKQDRAVTDLVQYTDDFGAFLASANPNLPKATVAALVKDHVLTLKPVIDQAAAGNTAQVYVELRKAMAHMDLIATPLAEGIVKQFPQRFAAK
jgi:uncharacterized membrane protein